MKQTEPKRKNGTGIRIVEWMLMLALIVVFVTGLVIHIAPTTPGKILHVISGFVLVICAIIHIVQRRKKRSAKQEILYQSTAGGIDVS